ncbi:glycosyltransferase family 1 protein [bacterium CPR1]|nr:glycosyltransferase family 1 protein [bacterium CPR1]
MKIRIVHVVESFCAGVLVSVTQIVNGLDPEKYDITLVYSRRPQTPHNVKALVHPHVKLIHLQSTREISPFQDLLVLLKLWWILMSVRPAVVHLHSSKAGALGRLAARFAGVRKIFYCPQGYSFLREDCSPLKRALFFRLEQILSLFGGTTLACSEGELEAARRMSAPARLLVNSVDLRWLDEQAAGVPPRSGPVTIAIVGRISPQQAPETFASVCGELQRLRPGTMRFLWIGGGDPCPELAANQVQVTGWLTHSEALRKIACETDIILHTSRWEGMPFALLEAMALKKPVVATPVVGNRDLVIDGKTGFLAEEPQMATAVLRLVEDARLRREFGEAARRRVEERFSVEVMVDSVTRLYAERS